MDAATRRINAPLLQQSSNKLVRVIGKCESYNSSSQQGIIISNGSINLDLSAATSSTSDNYNLLEINKIYEIIGKVSNLNGDLKINVYSTIKLTDNTNLKAADKLVELSNKATDLFY
ncbi:hypothetical protein KGF54_003870 [Candida jiufengensis]|uniref:uncharacterized protein n=1 Tax=Candida jiufengensis TaxID=497108 RepID=UPI002224FD58|nr:uncharacterized protein KGF54_003870 [Candida jiufengensis]KAI5950796.1 hypothetical protein KGF54_003870 [Candida jiufengensis]